MENHFFKKGPNYVNNMKYQTKKKKKKKLASRKASTEVQNSNWHKKCSALCPLTSIKIISIGTKSQEDITPKGMKKKPTPVPVDQYIPCLEAMTANCWASLYQFLAPFPQSFEPMAQFLSPASHEPYEQAVWNT